MKSSCARRNQWIKKIGTSIVIILFIFNQTSPIAFAYLEPPNTSDPTGTTVRTTEFDPNQSAPQPDFDPAAGATQSAGPDSPLSLQIPGDANGDGAVNFADYAILEASFGQTGTDLPADFDQDGDVDLDDFAILQINYENVRDPEPSPLIAASQAITIDPRDMISFMYNIGTSDSARVYDIGDPNDPFDDISNRRIGFGVLGTGWDPRIADFEEDIANGVRLIELDAPFGRHGYYWDQNWSVVDSQTGLLADDISAAEVDSNTVQVNINTLDVPAGAVVQLIKKVSNSEPSQIQTMTLDPQNSGQYSANLDFLYMKNYDVTIRVCSDATCQTILSATLVRAKAKVGAYQISAWQELNTIYRDWYRAQNNGQEPPVLATWHLWEDFNQRHPDVTIQVHVGSPHSDYELRKLADELALAGEAEPLLTQEYWDLLWSFYQPYLEVGFRNLVLDNSSGSGAVHLATKRVLQVLSDPSLRDCGGLDRLLCGANGPLNENEGVHVLIESKPALQNEYQLGFDYWIREDTLRNQQNYRAHPDRYLPDNLYPGTTTRFVRFFADADSLYQQISQILSDGHIALISPSGKNEIGFTNVDDLLHHLNITSIPRNIDLRSGNDNEENLTYTITQQPMDQNGNPTGTLEANPFYPYIYKFTPVPGFAGPVSFRYKITDGTHESEEATVTIYVGSISNPAPTEPPAPPIPGDVNRDGSVDAADSIIIQKMMDAYSRNLTADFTGDGIVGFEDFQVFLASLGVEFEYPLGDLNEDSRVDGADWIVVKKMIGQEGENLPWDLNKDGKVDDTDLAIVTANYGTAVVIPGDADRNGSVDLNDYNFILNAIAISENQMYQAADLNGDGRVDEADLAIWRSHFGQTAPSADVTPPVISNVVTSNLTDNRVTINWDTDEASTAQVEYITTSSYGIDLLTVLPFDPSPVTNHSVTLAGLEANTTYRFRVRSQDVDGNLTVAQDFTFTTAPLVPPLVAVSQAVTIDPRDLIAVMYPMSPGSSQYILDAGDPNNPYDDVSNRGIGYGVLTNGWDPLISLFQQHIDDGVRFIELDGPFGKHGYYWDKNWSVISPNAPGSLSYLNADGNGDHVVNQLDADVVRINLGKKGQYGEVPGDYDRNGIVNDADLVVWENYNSEQPQPAVSDISVSEPDSSTLRISTSVLNVPDGADVELIYRVVGQRDQKLIMFQDPLNPNQYTADLNPAIFNPRNVNFNVTIRVCSDSTCGTALGQERNAQIKRVYVKEDYPGAEGYGYQLSGLTELQTIYRDWYRARNNGEEPPVLETWNHWRDFNERNPNAIVNVHLGSPHGDAQLLQLAAALTQANLAQANPDPAFNALTTQEYWDTLWSLYDPYFEVGFRYITLDNSAGGGATYLATQRTLEVLSGAIPRDCSGLDRVLCGTNGPITKDETVHVSVEARPRVQNEYQMGYDYWIAEETLQNYQHYNPNCKINCYGRDEQYIGNAIRFFRTSNDGFWARIGSMEELFRQISDVISNGDIALIASGLYRGRETWTGYSGAESLEEFLSHLNVTSIPRNIDLRSGNDNEENLTYIITEPPIGGQLEANPYYPYIYRFIPDPGFSGIVTFRYKISNGTRESEEATITISVGSLSTPAPPIPQINPPPAGTDPPPDPQPNPAPGDGPPQPPQIDPTPPIMPPPIIPVAFAPSNARNMDQILNYNILKFEKEKEGKLAAELTLNENEIPSTIAVKSNKRLKMKLNVKQQDGADIIIPVDVPIGISEQKLPKDKIVDLSPIGKIIVWVDPDLEQGIDVKSLKVEMAVAAVAAPLPVHSELQETF